VGVVAVSAALLVAVLGVSGSITGSIDRLATSIGGDADLEVSGITDDGFDASLLDTVARVENVTAAVPLTRMPVTVRSTRALLLGVGQNVSELHSDLQTAIQDQLAAGPPPASAPNGVVVGTGIGVAGGDQFDVGTTRVTAVAVVNGRAAQRLNHGHFVIAPLALAQQISGRVGRLDSVLVFTKPGVDVDKVRAGVTAAVSGRAVVATPSFRAAQASSSFAILQAMTLLAASVSLVVAAFLSYNAMSIAIAQRRPTISTMRALGGRRRTIVTDMLGEAALVGLIGGVIGSFCGVVMGRVAIGRLPSTMVQSLEAAGIRAAGVGGAAGDRGVRGGERDGLGAGGAAGAQRRADRGTSTERLRCGRGGVATAADGRGPTRSGVGGGDGVHRRRRFRPRCRDVDCVGVHRLQCVVLCVLGPDHSGGGRGGAVVRRAGRAGRCDD
jgi:putative ABC transport system permease protein